MKQSLKLNCYLCERESTEDREAKRNFELSDLFTARSKKQSKKHMLEKIEESSNLEEHNSLRQ